MLLINFIMILILFCIRLQKLTRPIQIIQETSFLNFLFEKVK